MKSRFRHRSVLRLGQALQLSLLIGTCLGSSIGISWAGPEGGVVSQGNATINQNGNNTTINQTSNRALLDWQSFNIGQNESVNFIQTGASAIAINRIHDANPSTILGSLSANGQIMLINPNGVVFGNGAKVDVGSLVVSTASPTDKDASDFISGARNDLNLSLAGNPNAQIINNGMITAKSAGLVGFVAPGIINNGIIVANKGTVQLASGSTATLDLYGDGLVDIAVAPDVEQQLIEQRGWVQADGGKVVITAAAGEHIVNSVINMGGVTQANSIEQKDGKIILKGDDSTINVTGKIETSGRAQNQKGGTITVSAKHINLKSGSVVDASGDKGGGTIKIGGDYKGQGTLAHADTLTMDAGATIYNDAITAGNGGTTILWSDIHTYFAGDIFARGGATSGNGGFVETSGKKDLTAKGHIDLSTAHGAFGTWLLDPTDITIYNRSVGGTDNVNTLTTAYLESQSADIVLTADNNLTLDMTGDTMALGSKSLTLNATSGSISSLSDGTITTSGNIILNAGTDITLANDVDFTTSGAGAVTLRANTNIVYSGSGDITTAGGAIVLNSDRDATGGGGIYLGAGTNLTSNGGNITLGGGLDPTTTNAIGMSAAYPQGIYLTAAVLDARGVSTGGNISLRGQGSTTSTASTVQNSAQGLLIENTTIQTNLNGTLTLAGTGAGSTGYNLGVFLYSATNLSTVNGNISITGTGGNGSAGYGIALSSSGTTKIQSTGTGNISLTGTGYSGILLNSANGAIINKDGNITLTGTAINGGTFGIGTTSSGNASTVGSATSTGNISFITNALSWSVGTPTIQTTGDIIIRPSTAATTVGIGNGTGTLSITDAMLNNMTWGGTLWLGGYGLTGAESGYWNSAGNMAINSTRSFANNVNFLSGSNITAGSASTLTLTGSASTVLFALANVNFTQDIDFTATGTGSITLRAGGSIIYTGSGDLTTNGGAIILNADRDANGSGSISLGTGSNVVSNGGNITFGGGLDPTTSYAVGAGGGYGHGVSLGTLTVDARGSGAVGGNILVLGQGWNDSSCSNNCFGIVTSGTSLLTNNSGSISFNGVGGGGTSTNYGHGVLLGAGLVSTANGNINVTGRVTETSATAAGITIYNNMALTTSGTGNINLTDTGTLGLGLSLSTGASTITSGGNITYIGNKISGNTVTWNAAGEITIRPYTAGTTVDIGTASTGTLKITDALLNSMTWGGTLWLGGYTGSQGTNWNLSGNTTLNTTRSFGNHVNFLSGGNIVSGGAGTITLTGNASATLLSVGDINISHDLDITATGSGSVIERAFGNIIYSGSGDITTTSGSITLNADRDANGTGGVALQTGTELRTTSGDIILGGGTDPTTSNAINGFSNHGVYLNAALLNAGGTGNIILRGTGGASAGYGIYMLSSSITSANGNISLYGTSQAASLQSVDITTSTINSTNGNILLSGIATGGFGVVIWDNVTIASQTGDMRFEGKGIGNTGLYANATGTKTIGGATSSGKITYATDSVSGLENLTSQTTGDVIVRPYTAGTTVGIGSGTGTLVITDAALNKITYGGTLWLGGYGLTGAESGYWNSAGAMNIDTAKTFTKNVVFTSPTSLTAASTLTASGTANMTLVGGTGGISTAAITLGSGNLTLTGDTATWSGNITGTGNFLLQPYTSSRGMNINAGGSTGVLYVAGADITKLQSGWSSFNFGNNTLSNLVILGSVAWKENTFVNSGSADIRFSAATSTLVTNKSLTLTTASGDISSYYGAGGFVASGTGNITFNSGRDILFNTDFDLTTATGTVTLNANRNIAYNSNGDISTAGGNIILNSDRDANASGYIQIVGDTTLASNGGNITLGGGLDPTTGFTAGLSGGFGGSGISLADNGTGTLAPTINAGGGNIIMNGQGWMDASAVSARGITIKGAQIFTSGNGNITLNGKGGGASTSTTNNNHGIFAYASTDGALPLIQTQNGTLSLTGSSVEASTTPSVGLALTGSAIKTSGTGNIIIKVDNTAVTGTISGSGTIVSGGNLTYIGDTISASLGFSAAGDLIVRPNTAGATVGIGAASGTLQITDAVLNKLTYGGTLWLGGYGLTGAETGYWNSSGNMTLATTRTFGKNVNFISGASLLSSGNSTITLTGAANGLFQGGFVSFANDIDFTQTGTGNITLLSNTSIVYSGSGDITTNGGTITLNSNRVNGGGAISLGTGTVLTSNGGNIILGGGADPTAGNAVGTVNYAQGILLNGATLDARGASTTGGNISMRGTGYAASTNTDIYTNAAHGIFVTGGSTAQTNNSGTITLNATGGGTGVGRGSGVFLYNGAAILGVNGDINVTGTGGTGTNGEGVGLSGTGTNKIQSTGSGNIIILGTGGTNSGVNNHGFASNAGAPNGILSATGAISITGIAGNGASSYALVTSTAGTNIGGTSATGNISLIGNTYSWSVAPTIKTSGDVKIGRAHV